MNVKNINWAIFTVLLASATMMLIIAGNIYKPLYYYVNIAAHVWGVWFIWIIVFEIHKWRKNKAA